MLEAYKLRNLRLVSSTLTLFTLCIRLTSKSHAHWLFADAELTGEVMVVYKEAVALAWHSLASCLHSACRHCAAKYALAIPMLKFLWKELCGDCRHGMRAGTGDYSTVVMGCEMVVVMLVASVACMAPLP